MFINSLGYKPATFIINYFEYKFVVLYTDYRGVIECHVFRTKINRIA